jgi:ribosome-binding ATPase YchF (GTP1/OBG family)
MSLADAAVYIALQHYKDAEFFYSDEEYEKALYSLMRGIQVSRNILLISQEQSRNEFGIVSYHQDEKIQHLFFLADKLTLIISCYLELEVSEAAKYFIEELKKIINKLSEKKSYLSVERREELVSLAQLSRGFETALQKLKSHSRDTNDVNFIFTNLRNSFNVLCNLKVSLL